MFVLWRKMIQFLANKTTPYFQRLRMSNIYQSLFRIHEVSHLQRSKRLIIPYENVN